MFLSCTLVSTLRNAYFRIQAVAYAAITSQAVVKDNARAAPLLVSGAAGWYSECVNGFFAPTQEKGRDGRVVYMKCGDNSTCIEHCGGRWSIRSVSNRNGLYAGVSCKCSLEACGSRKWSVHTATKFAHQQMLNVQTGSDIERKVSCQPQASHFMYVHTALMRVASDQAAEHTAAVARAITEDNARAIPVLISGATGPYEKRMNGFFAPSSERSLDGRVVYKKCDTAHTIIEHYSGQWQIKPPADKGANAMHGGVVGGCALESCVGRVWFVGGSGKWIDQLVTISFGADVERQVNARCNSTPPSSQPHDACCSVQAANCAEKAARSVAQFNASAVPVLLSGATGYFNTFRCMYESMNGYYVPTQESTVDGCVIYSKCGDANTCIERVNETWNLRSVDQRGTKLDNRTAWFDAVDSSGFLKTGPLILGGTLRVSTKFDKTHPFTITVSIGAEVDRQVSVCCQHSISARIHCPPFFTCFSLLGCCARRRGGASNP